MLDPTGGRRPLVLLLAGEAREGLTLTLEAGGFEVSTTGWLDAVTAARLRRPDAVVVSTDLPEGAPRTLVTGFRSGTDLYRLPVVVAGPGVERLDDEAFAPLRADRYLPAPVDAAALAAAVGDAVRTVLLPWHRRPGAPIDVAFMVVAAAAFLLVTTDALVVRLGIPLAGRAGLLALALTSLGVAVVRSLARQKRPIPLPKWRRLLFGLGLIFMQLTRFFPEAGDAGLAGATTLWLVPWAGWAWLGPVAKPRTPGVRRAFHVLAVSLLLLGTAPRLFLLARARG